MPAAWQAGRHGRRGTPVAFLPRFCARRASDGTHLFQIAENGIRKLDPRTGSVLSKGGKSGPVWAEGSLWVGHYRERMIHRIDPATGKRLDALAMPSGVGLSGLESDGAGLFYCGDAGKNALRAVRRPKRA